MGRGIKQRDWTWVNHRLLFRWSLNPFAPKCELHVHESQHCATCCCLLSYCSNHSSRSYLEMWACILSTACSAYYWIQSFHIIEPRCLDTTFRLELLVCSVLSRGSFSVRFLSTHWASNGVFIGRGKMWVWDSVCREPYLAALQTFLLLFALSGSPGYFKPAYFFVSVNNPWTAALLLSADLSSLLWCVWCNNPFSSGWDELSEPVLF